MFYKLVKQENQSLATTRALKSKIILKVFAIQVFCKEHFWQRPIDQHDISRIPVVIIKPDTLQIFRFLKRLQLLHQYFGVDFAIHYVQLIKRWYLGNTGQVLGTYLLPFETEAQKLLFVLQGLIDGSALVTFAET